MTAVLVLYGLPRLLTGSILAHEMMHAWLRLKDLDVPLQAADIPGMVLKVTPLFVKMSKKGFVKC